MSDAPERIWLRWELGAAVTQGPLTTHPDYTGWVRENVHRAQVAALTEELDAAKAGLSLAQELLIAASELAQYASYAEIVGGVSVNRKAIRKYCDEIFNLRRTLPEDENFEPSFAALKPAPVSDEALIRAAIEAAEDQVRRVDDGWFDGVTADYHSHTAPVMRMNCVGAIRALATPEGIAAIRERAKV